MAGEEIGRRWDVLPLPVPHIVLSHSVYSSTTVCVCRYTDSLSLSLYSWHTSWPLLFLDAVNCGYKCSLQIVTFIDKESNGESERKQPTFSNSTVSI